MKRIFSLSQEDRKWMYLGIFGALIIGLSYPITGMMNGYQIENLAREEGDDLINLAYYYSGIKVFTALCIFLGLILQSVSFPRSSANITVRMRKMGFKSLLSYEPGYFDMPQQNSTVIASRLSTDCEKLNTIGGTIIGLMIGLIAGLLASHGMAAIFSWQIALASFVITPVIIIG